MRGDHGINWPTMTSQARKQEQVSGRDVLETNFQTTFVNPPCYTVRTITLVISNMAL